MSNKLACSVQIKLTVFYDIINAVHNDNIDLFADDSNLFIHGKSKTEATQCKCMVLSKQAKLESAQFFF